jgi:glutaredoxin
MKKLSIKSNFLLYLIILILIIIIVIMKVFPKNNLNINSEGINIQEIIDNKETKLIYVYSSNEKRCKYCSKVTSYLEQYNLSYLSINIEDISKEDYHQFLNTLEIDEDIFGYPALIYIKAGEMFANIINIDNVEVVEQFISDYDLNLLYEEE